MVAAVRVEATDLSESDARASLSANDVSGSFMLDHAAQAQQIVDEGGLPTPQPLKLAPVTPGHFRFRTKPGRRRTTVYLRVYQDHPVSETNVRMKNAWERSKLHAYGKDWKKEIQPDQDLYKATGMTEIAFEPIGESAEAEFVTDDPQVAAYLRYRLPSLPHIYEEIQPMMVEVNGELVEVMPTTIAGQQKVARMQAGQR